MREEEKPEAQPEREWKLTCFRCGANKYCPDCIKSYEETSNFCAKCGKPLETLEAFEEKNCPVCSTKVMHGFCKVLKTRTFEMPPLTEDQREKMMRPISGGVIMTRYCDCGKYRPCSTHGVIDDSCAHCGGKPRPVICRGRVPHEKNYF